MSNSIDLGAGKRYLIVDLEATCWENKSQGTGEIIEIGAVMYEVGKLVLSEFGSFVRPKLSAHLSEFCTRLTSIRDGDIAGAPALPEALAKLLDWARPFEPWTFGCWGDYDRNQFERDCRLHGIPCPFGEHVNIKKACAAWKGCSPKPLGAAVGMLGLAFEGTAHRGIDDARNIARVITAMAVAQMKG